MFLISNNLQKFHKNVTLSKDTIIRINCAWANDLDQLEEIIKKNSNRTIYLDFPQGRSKTPRPKLFLQDVVGVVKKFKNIGYFAVSNVENPKELTAIGKLLPSYVSLVPKIETLSGVINLREIIKEAKINVIMLDAEDLAKDLDHHNNTFDKCISEVRKTCKKCNVTLLELVGVAFANKE